MHTYDIPTIGLISFCCTTINSTTAEASWACAQHDYHVNFVKIKCRTVGEKMNTRECYGLEFSKLCCMQIHLSTWAARLPQINWNIFRQSLAKALFFQPQNFLIKSHGCRIKNNERQKQKRCNNDALQHVARRATGHTLQLNPLMWKWFWWMHSVHAWSGNHSINPDADHIIFSTLHIVHAAHACFYYLLQRNMIWFKLELTANKQHRNTHTHTHTPTIVKL